MNTNFLNLQISCLEVTDIVSLLVYPSLPLYMCCQVTSIHYFECLHDHWCYLDYIAICLFVELLSPT